jgi:hemoglobin
LADIDRLFFTFSSSAATPFRTQLKMQGILARRKMLNYLRHMADEDLYSLIGEDGFTRLIAAFYRQVPHDDILGPMYPEHERAAAEVRLRDFLIYRFGGPERYIAQRGHPRLRARHLPFPIDRAARDRWMQLMNKAFAEAALPSEAEQLLRSFFEQISTFMINQA